MTLTHDEACTELRKVARLLGEGKVTLDEWYQSVRRILRARTSSAPARVLVPSGAPR